MDVVPVLEELESVAASPRPGSLLTDADVAEIIQGLAEALAVGRRDSQPSSDASRVTQVGFRLAADHPEWTLTPVAASEAFDKLIREPRILAAYASGVPVDEIERRFGIAKSSLYAFLASEGIAVNRPRSGRPRRVDHAAVRLAANDGLSLREIAARHGCAERTVKRILDAPQNPHIQAFIDRLSVVEPGERLRGAWNRYLDALAAQRDDIENLGEPEWPAEPDRRALAAAAIAYWFHHLQIDEPSWLLSPNLVSPEITSPVPEFIEIARPLTPTVVARYNVALDADSFHSV